MAEHSKRECAIRLCLEQGEAPRQVAAVLGVPASTLRGWLKLARLEHELQNLRQECDSQRQRQDQLVAELHQAAAALADLKRLLVQEDQAAHRAAG